MTIVLLGDPDGLVRVRVADRAAVGERVLDAGPVSTVSIDPLRPELIYATTRGAGFWRSGDGGVTWERGGEGIGLPLMSASTVSRTDRADERGAVYVGTVYSSLYRSTDGGVSFEELAGFQAIPSRPEWSFPPAPDRHHVQSLATDIEDPDRLFVGIEVGGVMRSNDRGATWEDHNDDVDADPHVLLTHPDAPGRVYVGGGGAYCQTLDGGETWQRELDGFEDDIRYFYALAVDPGDPETVLLVSGRDHITGHALIPGRPAWSTLYRRSPEGWHEVSDGLPEREGNEMGHLATDGQTPGLFFYVTVNGRLFRSTDAGRTWNELELAWPADGPATVLALAATHGEI